MVYWRLLVKETSAMWFWCSKKSRELEMQLSEMPVCSFDKAASVGERARGLGTVRREGRLGLSPCTHTCKVWQPRAQRDCQFEEMMIV